MITREKADKYSLLKWKFLSKKGHDDSRAALDALLELYPVFKKMFNFCAYCSYNRAGYDCPLKPKCKFTDPICIEAYRVWKDKPTAANAKRILTLVKSVISYNEINKRRIKRKKQ